MQEEKDYAHSELFFPILAVGSLLVQRGFVIPLHRVQFQCRRRPLKWVVIKQHYSCTYGPPPYGSAVGGGAGSRVSEADSKFLVWPLRPGQRSLPSIRGR